MDLREMDLYVYNTDFQIVGIVDNYISLIWTDRYNQTGDFELTLPYNAMYYSMIKHNYYCTVNYTDRFSIVEKIEVIKDEESAPQMKVSGRSLESILERRVIATKTTFGDDNTKVSLQNSVQTLLNNTIINPSDTKRKIPNFSFSASGDTKITSLQISESFDGESVYEAIEGICQDKYIGFRLLFDPSFNMIFSLYKGKDLSDKVIFSPYYDNLKSSSYFSSVEEYKNVMLVSKSENSYVAASCLSEMPSGLARREVQEDASSLKENESTTLTNKQLQEKAVKKLKKDYKIKTGFEGEIVPDVMYSYRTDYNVGDRVTLEDGYGNSEVVQISEVVITFDENGLSIIPTFEEIEEETEETEETEE